MHKTIHHKAHACILPEGQPTTHLLVSALGNTGSTAVHKTGYECCWPFMPIACVDFPHSPRWWNHTSGVSYLCAPCFISSHVLEHVSYVSYERDDGVLLGAKASWGPIVSMKGGRRGGREEKKGRGKKKVFKAHTPAHVCRVYVELVLKRGMCEHLPFTPLGFQPFKRFVYIFVGTATHPPCVPLPLRPF